MNAGTTWKWFAVKSLYRVSAKGAPQGRDAAFDPDMTLVEERVVLFRARNHDEAIARAEKEALDYCTDAPFRNPYGQTVVHRSLSAFDSFELFNPPASGREVYSRTEVLPRSVSDAAVAVALLGPARDSARVEASRRNVLDIIFNAPAEGVTPTEAEAETMKRVMRSQRRVRSAPKASSKSR